MNYYDGIKQILINNEITKKVKDYSKNKSDLDTYYEVGKLLIEAQGGEARAKYGDKLIEEYSKKLTNELGNNYLLTTVNMPPGVPVATVGINNGKNAAILAGEMLSTIKPEIIELLGKIKNKKLNL